MKILKYLLSFVLVTFSLSLLAQNAKTYSASFTKLSGFKVNELGVYFDKVELQNRYDTAKIVLQNVATEVVSSELPSNIVVNNGKPELQFSYGVARKKLIAGFRLPLFFKENGIIYKVKSFDLGITEEEAPKVAMRTYVSNSVLNSGNWYKISINKRGVYKIDYNFLQSLGVNPSTINPNNIRVYGNGGTVMKEAVLDGSPDDLVENSIEVHASGSSFGQNDYVLFYANGPITWSPSGDNSTFTHTQNYYEDNSYYFINFDLGSGKRIETKSAINASATATITNFDAYEVIDKDSINFTHIGRMWFSNQTNRGASSAIPVDLKSVTGDVTMSYQIIGTSDNGIISFNLNQNSTFLKNGSMDAPPGNFSRVTDYKIFTPPTSGEFSIILNNTSSNINATIYLDYLRFNYKRPLNFINNQQFNFRSYQQKFANAGTFINYQINNANASIKIWDVSNSLQPTNLSYQLSGTQINLIDSSAILKEYVVFDGSNFLTPSFVAKIANQDLHALSQVDYLIITNKSLVAPAEKLANLHRTKYGTTVHVVTVDKIYNEFSSGGQDIGGIRNFIKMFYERSNGNHDLRNVLLFGTASFDFKDRIDNNTNLVPVYETYESNTSPYSTDEFYTILDDGESMLAANSGNYIDMGIGRIPVKNEQEAFAYVNKVEIYTGSKGFGEWKTNSTFVSDDYERGFDFLESIEKMSNQLNESNDFILQSKLYTDASPRVATPGGIKFPSITRDINNQINNGTFLMNYIGHGSPERWAVEELLYEGDVSKWHNQNKLPIIITATCDFGRFDNPLDTAVGVQMVNKSDGGAIAALTTTMSVYEGPNNLLNQAYIDLQFSKMSNGQYRTLGEAFAESKNFINVNFGTGNQENSRKFVLLGDPAIKPSLPENNIFIDSIFEADNNGNLIYTDTFKSLGKYVIKGYVADLNSNIIDDFNGNVFVTIVDKLKTVSATNPALLADPTDQKTYTLQNNILFKGNTTVTDGEFTINVIIPKDINFDFGTGKMILYAYNETEDAGGTDTNFVVGGFSPYATSDNDGPIVKPFIDNNKFRSGDIVSENPVLYVELEDENGINISGSSIGHDLIAVLDGDYANPYILNTYYQTMLNDYTKGSLYYQLSRLEPGKHTITVRAWDIYNNPGEGSIEFEVKDGEALDFNLYNYPNPFNSSTNIVLQHNQPNVEMDVSLKIFSSNGQLVFNDQKSIKPTGSFTTWTWDGTSLLGATVGNGVYIYQATIKTSKGLSKTLYNKLVFAR